MEDRNNAFRDDERLNFAPPPKPFSKFKIVELSLCALAVVFGLVYMYTDIVPLEVLLPVFCAFFTTVPILRYIDAKKSGGGFVALIPAMCWGLLAVCVIAATVLYFVFGK